MLCSEPLPKLKELPKAAERLLRKILERELTALLEYVHYFAVILDATQTTGLSLSDWLRDKEKNSLKRAQVTAEILVRVGGYRQPEIQLGLVERLPSSVPAILNAALEGSNEAVSLYQRLLTHAEGHSFLLADYARQMILQEQKDGERAAKLLEVAITGSSIKRTRQVKLNGHQRTTQKLLLDILEHELAGLLAYEHYWTAMFGLVSSTGLPMSRWARGQVSECLHHAEIASEMLVRTGGYRFPECHFALINSSPRSVSDILRDAGKIEEEAIALYQKLLVHTKGSSIMLAEYARQLIIVEQQDASILENFSEIEPVRTGKR